MIDGWGIYCEITLIRMSLDFTDDQSALVQVMACCLTAPSHYLSQCWPRSLLPYGVTRPQWVKLVNGPRESTKIYLHKHNNTQHNKNRVRILSLKHHLYTKWTNNADTVISISETYRTTRRVSWRYYDMETLSTLLVFVMGIRWLMRSSDHFSVVEPKCRVAAELRPHDAHVTSV